ncbi:MAG: hypothetical protein ACK4YF_05075 [Exilispira sp.]
MSKNINKKIFTLLFILLLAIFFSFNQDSDINNFFEFSNDNFEIYYNNIKVTFDEISYHIYIYIIIGFTSTSSDYLDSIFYEFYQNNKKEIDSIRFDFINYCKKNFDTINDYILKSYIKEENIQLKSIYKSILLSEIFMSFFNSEEIYKNLIITKYNSCIISIIFKYLIMNKDIFYDLLSKSDIYEKIKNYLKNFLYNFRLIEPLKEFYSFYSLNFSKVKISFIYYDNSKNRGGFYENGKIYLYNCFNDLSFLYSIFFHELVHFNDLYSKGYERGNQIINIRDIMNSVFLENKFGSTDESSIKKIKEFINKYIIDIYTNETNGLIFSELYADLAMIYFLNFYSKKFSFDLINYNKITSHIKVFEGEDPEIKIPNSGVSFYPNSKIIDKYPENTLYIEFINYLIKNDEILNLRYFIFQENKDHRDNVIYKYFNTFISEEIDKILLNGKWILKKNIKLIFRELGSELSLFKNNFN